MLMLVRLEHLLNAHFSIVVTDAGNDIDVRLTHSSNTFPSIVVRLEEGGMPMSVRLDSQNAPSCIVVTDGGNDIDVRLVHL